MKEYGVDQITVLSQREHVRLRPAMYIGTTESTAQLVFEIVDNAVDEAVAGFGKEIDVHVDRDYTVTVVDHGRGIPRGPHPTEVDTDGRPMDTLTVTLTTLNAGGKFRADGAYESAGGMHGVGSTVTNFLAEHFEVTVRRDGGEFHQTFTRGVPDGPVIRVGDADDTGTTITYRPDPEIFKRTLAPGERLAGRLDELASLNPGVTIHYVDDVLGVDHTYLYDDGIAGYVLRAVGERQRLYERPFRIHGEWPIPTDVDERGGKVVVDVAFIHDDEAEPHGSLKTFANNINTVDGGTHRLGFAEGLREMINEVAAEKRYAKSTIEARYLNDGLYAVVSVKIPNAEMEGQTKSKLGNKAAQLAVKAVVREGIAELIKTDEWAKAFDAVILRAVRTKEAEEAARRARNAARKTREVATSDAVIPGKLAECINRTGYRELFIVEGNSAAGSAKEGRFKEFQAILALRGKVLNVLKTSLERMLASEAIKNLIIAFGTGVGKDFRLDKLRYNKIIIMTDSDVDGAHIQILLITFIYTYMRPLLTAGKVYLAISPLYRVTFANDKIIYLDDDKAFASFKKSNKRQYVLGRNKGLGELTPEQLRETTLDPSKRKLRRLTLGDAAEATRMFNILMGKQVEPRREFIERNALTANVMI